MTMDESKEEVAEAPETTTSRPVARFTGSGGLSVAVWANRNDSGLTNYSIRLDRNYKADDGNYKSTPYLRDGDLLRAQKLLEEADAWIEQDKGRQRGPAAGQAR